MKTSVLILSTALALAGCASQDQKPVQQPAPKRPPQAQLAPTAAPYADKRVLIDPELNGAIRLVGVATGAAAQGFLRIELGVQNVTASAASFGYQIEWLNRDGISMDLASPDLPMTLNPHEASAIVAIAPTPVARNFRVFLFPSAKILIAH